MGSIDLYRRPHSMPSKLEAMSRVELLEFALRLKVNDADVMTRPELRSAIQMAQQPRKRSEEAPVTWLGVARRLVASVIEQGLNLPEAASLVRGDLSLAEPPVSTPPVATVTLARIYAAQGHVQKAVDTLQLLLVSEPDHDPARELYDRLRNKLGKNTKKSSVKIAEKVTEKPADKTADKPLESVKASVTPDSPVQLKASATPATPLKATKKTVSKPAAVMPAAPSAPAVQTPAARTRAAYPQVVLVRTEDDELFAYWEAAPSGASQLILVAHGVNNAPEGRQERAFSVHSMAGAMELVGVDPGWVMRAMLRSGSATGSGTILAVASCIVSEGTSRPGNMDIDFSPHASALSKEIGLRAAAYLATAPVNNW